MDQKIMDFKEPPEAAADLRNNLFYVITTDDVLCCSKTQEVGKQLASFKKGIPKRF
jgi:hypothetical protein